MSVMRSWTRAGLTEDDAETSAELDTIALHQDGSFDSATACGFHREYRELP